MGLQTTPAAHSDRIVLLAAILACWAIPFFLYVPFDYGRWLGPWYAEILREGRIGVFAEPFGNYSPPYLYLLSASTLLDPIAPPLFAIKALSAAGAVWLATAVYSLLNSAGSERPVEGALWSLLIPTTLINVPLLGQADCFWVAPALLAVSAAFRRNNLAMVAWAGLAFAFKAQAVFLAPFVVALLLRRRVPLWYWPIPALIYVAAMLPAWLVGWPFADLLTVYLRQVAWVPASGVPFVSNAANWWLIFKSVDLQAAISSFAIGYFLAAIGAVAYVWKFRKDERPAYLILAAALSAAMLPWLLPGMHERFFFLAEMLTFCAAWLARDRLSVGLALLMQAGLFLAVMGWLTRIEGIAIASFFPVTAALVIMAREFLVCGRGEAVAEPSDQEAVA